ncbi:MAG: FtsW/RodA/SpoVE family cell cycle protein [Lachnospiraceae bacterium]|nr:FtsW/RodA/SpoVE family cell cycle protein [Lachnospiraceae bacterium]
MGQLLIDSAKYIIMIAMVVFTFSAYHSVFTKKTDPDDSTAEKLQLVCVFVVQFIGNIAVALHTSDGRILSLYFLQFFFVLVYNAIFLKAYKSSSMVLVNIVSMLLTIGIIMLERINPELVFKHCIIIAVFVVISLIIPPAVKLLESSDVIAVLCAIVGILALTVILVFANYERGAKLSIPVGGISFQASEFVKITFVLMCAGLFKDKNKKGNIALGTLFMIVHIAILVLSRDLGMSLILGSAYLFMLFMAVDTFAILALGVIAVGIGSFFAYRFFAHVKTRVDVWLNPWQDITGDGYQIAQSLFAIGTGGWMGSGFYKGIPETIPIVTKDFIFAAIAEELGGITAFCLILIYLAFVIKVMLMAMGAASEYIKLVLVGFGCIFAVQVILNIGGVIKFIPSTGITLPFISYGGSSIASLLIMFGLIQGFGNLKRIK